MVFVTLVPILTLYALLAGIQGLGRWTRSQIGDSDRYLLTNADFEFQAPIGYDRDGFLEEIRKGGLLDEPLSILSEATSARIRNAFANHPMIESVEDVAIQKGPRVALRLKYRKPVLAVVVSGKKRVIDRYSYLLPWQTGMENLPVYISPVAGSEGVPGTLWKDEGLAQAAETIAFLQEESEIPAIASVQHYVDGLVLTTRNGALISWGHPVKDKAKAISKRNQLCKLIRMSGGEKSSTSLYDLRSLD